MTNACAGSRKPSRNTIPEHLDEVARLIGRLPLPIE